MERQLKIYHNVSQRCNKMITHSYTTSFSIGIYMLDKSLRKGIYSIYGFVRLADEIVDTFIDYPRKELLERFREDIYLAIKNKVSFNPVLHSLQHTIHQYNIPIKLVEQFLVSMKMDIFMKTHTKKTLDAYILGSAQVVGLMCLKIFCNKHQEKYTSLIPGAMALGSVFQKINFIRDLKNDFIDLGRNYFPEINLNNFDVGEKTKIEKELEKEFKIAYIHIIQLPKNCRFAVLVSYFYFYTLFKKIKNKSPSHILKHRVRISNFQKIFLIFSTFIRYKLLYFKK